MSQFNMLYQNCWIIKSLVAISTGVSIFWDFHNDHTLMSQYFFLIFVSEIQSFECVLTLSAELVLKTDLFGKGSWVNLF